MIRRQNKVAQHDLLQEIRRRIYKYPARGMSSKKGESSSRTSSTRSLANICPRLMCLSTCTSVGEQDSDFILGRILSITQYISYMYDCKVVKREMGRGRERKRRRARIDCNAKLNNAKSDVTSLLLPCPSDSLSFALRSSTRTCICFKFSA